jgi:hypothetical protein
MTAARAKSITHCIAATPAHVFGLVTEPCGTDRATRRDSGTQELTGSFQWSGRRCGADDGVERTTVWSGRRCGADDGMERTTLCCLTA